MSKSKLENLLEYLIAMRNSIRPWVIRRELSAWAAVVLYLSGLFALFKIIEDMKENCFPFIIAICLSIVCLLILLFLFKQYDAIFNSLALERALDFWIFRLIDASKIPNDFDFTIDVGQSLPESIITKIEPYKDKISQYKGFKKVLPPFIFVKKKLLKQDYNISPPEIQESIIYDIVIIFTMFLLFYIESIIDWYCFLFYIF